MRKRKDPELNPYICLIDPDPGGQKHLDPQHWSLVLSCTIRGDSCRNTDFQFFFLALKILSFFIFMGFSIWTEQRAHVIPRFWINWRFRLVDISKLVQASKKGTKNQLQLIVPGMGFFVAVAPPLPPPPLIQLADHVGYGTFCTVWYMEK